MTRDEHGAAPANACRRPVPSAAAALTVVVLVVGTATAVATLAWSGSFPNPFPESVDSSVLAEARGWSAATLFVAIPLGVAALRAALRGSLRARLCWLGVLANLVHTYLERAVSPPFTALHLPYVAAGASAWSVAPFAVLWAVATTAAVRFFRSGVHSRASYERVAGAWGAPCTD